MTTYPYTDDPDPDRVKTLLYDTMPPRYAADNAARWADMGFGGFIRPDVMAGWETDVWLEDGRRRVTGDDNASLNMWREVNSALGKAGVTDNFMSIAFAKRLPDWFDDEAWSVVVENFRQGARFAKKAGFAGVALDDEYIEEMWGLYWEPYLKRGYPRDRLAEQARLRGRQIQEAMLSEFPEMVNMRLPEGYSIHGELSRQMFIGALEVLSEADAPGGMHILTESTYLQTSPDLMVAHYCYGLDRILLHELPGDIAEYWKRRCSIAPGLAPLGYLRPIRDASGKRIGFGGRSEIFGDRPIEPGEDKSGNYPPDTFQAVYSAARMTSRRYVWIYSSGPSWYQMSDQEYERYGGHWTQKIALAPNFEEYLKVVRHPKIIATPEFAAIHRAALRRESIDVLRGLGFPPHWWMAGPYPNARGSGHDQVFPPELGFDPEAICEGPYGPVRWRRVDTPPTGYMDLSRLIAGGVEILGYAATFIHTPRETRAVVRFGCDDTGKIWLNGSLIWATNTERRAMPDEDLIPVRLPTGPTTMLVKVGNYRGGWGFYLRITDEDGGQIPFLTYPE